MKRQLRKLQLKNNATPQNPVFINHKKTNKWKKAKQQMLNFKLVQAANKMLDLLCYLLKLISSTHYLTLHSI